MTQEEHNEIEKAKKFISDLKKDLIGKMELRYQKMPQDKVMKMINKADDGDKESSEDVLEVLLPENRKFGHGALCVIHEAVASIKIYEANRTPENLNTVHTTIAKAVNENKEKLVKGPSFLSICFAYLSNIMSGKAEQAVTDLREKAYNKSIDEMLKPLTHNSKQDESIEIGNPK